MPKRIIDGEITNSESLSQVSILAVLIFILLITKMDDHGRCDGRPRLLHRRLFPLHDEVTLKDVESGIEELVREGCLHRYDVDGRLYLHMPAWGKFQRLRYESREKHPAPTCCPTPEPRGDSPQPAATRRRSRPEAEVEVEAKAKAEAKNEESAPAGATLCSEAFDCVDLLNQSIEKSTPGAKTATTEREVETWAAELDRLHRIGAPGTDHGWPWEQIEAVLHWLPTHQGSNGFTWGQQVRSAGKLRSQFPRLHAEMMKISSGSMPARRDRAQRALQGLMERQELRERAAGRS